MNVNCILKLSYLNIATVWKNLFIFIGITEISIVSLLSLSLSHRLWWSNVVIIYNYNLLYVKIYHKCRNKMYGWNKLSKFRSVLYSFKKENCCTVISLKTHFCTYAFSKLQSFYLFSVSKWIEYTVKFCRLILKVLYTTFLL